MGWFTRKNDDVLDLTERYRKQQEKTLEIKENLNEPKETSAPTGFGVFGMPTPTPSESTENYQPEDKKKKLAKRIMAMTDKLEDLSNQIYHLQQRVEVLEKKGGSVY